MNMLGQVLMPTFSQIQNDHRRINRVLARVTSVVILVMVPGLVFAAVSGRNLLGLFYGHRYAAAYWPLVVAGFVALINLVNAQITTILYASGRPQLHRRCVAFMAVAMVILIYPLVKHLGGGRPNCLSDISFDWLCHSSDTSTAVDRVSLDQPVQERRSRWYDHFRGTADASSGAGNKIDDCSHAEHRSWPVRFWFGTCPWLLGVRQRD